MHDPEYETSVAASLADDTLFTDLPLEGIRVSDAALHAYTAYADPRIDVALGLSDRVLICPTVTDGEGDYALVRFIVDSTPDMTPWDFMRIAAERWASCRVMNDFTLADLWLEEGGIILGINLWSDDFTELAEADLDQMPLHESIRDPANRPPRFSDL